MNTQDQEGEGGGEEREDPAGEEPGAAEHHPCLAEAVQVQQQRGHGADAGEEEPTVNFTLAVEAAP